MASQPAGGEGDVSPTGNNPGNTTNPKMRKRTKTGCLTCRKRRIKCGEERPTCANCIKSKRQCEGYNQRVVFKPPIGDWPNHPGVVSTLQYHNSMLPGTRNPGQRGPQAAVPSQESNLTSIQPRPMGYDFPGVDGASVSGLGHQNFIAGPSGYVQDANYQQPLHSPHHQQPLHSPQHQLPTPTTASSSYFPQPSPVHSTFQSSFAHEAPMGYQDPRYSQGAQYQQIPVSYDTPADARIAVSQAPQQQQQQMLYQHQQPSASTADEHSNYVLQPTAPVQSEDYSYADPRPSLNRFGSNNHISAPQPHGASIDPIQAISYTQPPAVSYADRNFSSFQIPQYDVNADVKYVSQHAALEQPVAAPQPQQGQAQILLSGFGGEDHVSPTQVLDEAAVEYQDDDYWDVLSDEEMVDDDDDQDENAVMLGRDFSLMRQIHFESMNELTVRRYDAFIYEGILTHYKAENVANPLKNPKTARVFAHFIHVTGPSLSIFERNPRNPISIFEGPTPPSQRSFWTYILPLKALNHQGLLHAMLALASLHIARLQRASVTPSYKHYAYALKSLSRSLGNPKRRLSIPTLATSLILAFYEVTTAEHNKWSTHLVGAAQLLSEMDYRSLTREARRLKAAQRAEAKQFPYNNPDMLIDQRQFDQQLKESAMMPDEELVSTIVGKKVSYDDYGVVLEEGNTRQNKRPGMPGEFDLSTYETLQDLYWWYARHDTFQSMVSGNPLIMDYRKWSDCPPRAPLGRADALYGTHDHIILLMGRISDFTVRDRERKLKQMSADGGQWRPRQGMPGMGPPPSKSPAGQPPTPTTPMGPPLHMQGMGPPPGWTGPPPPGWPQMPPAGPPSGGAMGPPPASQGAQPGQNPQQGQPPRGPPPGMPNFFGMAPSRPPIPLPTTYANPEHVPHGTSPKPSNTPHPKYADLPAAYDAAIADWNSISQAHATIARFLANTDAFAPLTPDLYPVAPGGNMTPFGPALIHRSYDISILWSMLHLANILLLRSHPAMPPAAMMAASICAQATQPYAILIGRIAAGMRLPLSDEAPLTPSLGAALIESTMSLFFAGVQYQDPAQRDWLITRLLEIDRRTGWASAGVIARACETSYEKAADMGKGPPYKRRTRRMGEPGPIVIDAEGTTESQGWNGGSVHNTSSNRGRAQTWHEVDDKTGNGDTRFIVKYHGGKAPWAMNLLSTDEDLMAGMEKFGIGEDFIAGGENN
ncbi:hypothetical protein BS50DRAFT_632992 [Corynespora cassiicola Philippines]|uniref:Zn(2)-C6 fungal-type domain-containing protein n=1 Tax=Corynespora cassiicola Philippines TaxID=1448308 RepID=A0A2T2NV06_CORCC|nr:hypothetical protein BS50DRAFT_632992 [Corynespora cassiicola Philippines]